MSLPIAGIREALLAVVAAVGLPVQVYYHVAPDVLPVERSLSAQRTYVRRRSVHYVYLYLNRDGNKIKTKERTGGVNIRSLMKITRRLTDPHVCSVRVCVYCWDP
jgi:hypothetical protein